MPCAHPDHGDDEPAETVRRRFKGTDYEREFCPSHDPLADPDAAAHFEAVETHA